jgi:hypothetical protein
MSAVDRMGVRVRGGGYRSLPRRQALAMIAAGRAQADPGSRLAEPSVAPQEPAEGVEPPTVPATPETPPTAPQRVQTFQFQPDGPRVGVDGTSKPSRAPDLEPVHKDDVDAGEDVPTVYAVELPPEPKATARRSEWAEYADSLGVEVTSAMTKRDIQQAAEEAAMSLANLPQPARTGGRLETPEDEPAAETVADDPDTRTR